MSRRKYKKGALVKSLDELFLHEYFIVNGKTQHRGWVQSWQLGLAKQYIDRGVVFVAEPIIEAANSEEAAYV